MKLTAADRDIPVSDYDVFRLLDTLKPTATGLDGIRRGSSVLERRYLRAVSQAIQPVFAHRQCPTSMEDRDNFSYR